MSKINISKLCPIKKVEPKEIMINNEKVIVKQYLGVDEKSQFCADILSLTFDDTGFSSPLRQEIYFSLLVLKYYTNITLNDTALTNAGKTYDALKTNNVFKTIFDTIPQEEFVEIWDYVDNCISSVERYNTSVMGILKAIQNDQELSKIKSEEILKDLNDPESFKFLKEVMDKIG